MRARTLRTALNGILAECPFAYGARVCARVWERFAIFRGQRLARPKRAWAPRRRCSRAGGVGRGATHGRRPFTPGLFVSVYSVNDDDKCPSMPGPPGPPAPRLPPTVPSRVYVRTTRPAVAEWRERTFGGALAPSEMSSSPRGKF